MLTIEQVPNYERAVTLLGFEEVRNMRPIKWSKWCKMERICPKCGKEARGYSDGLCSRHHSELISHRHYHYNYVERHRRYQKLVNQNLCPRCLCYKGQDDHVYCESCREDKQFSNPLKLSNWDYKIGSMFPKKMSKRVFIEGMRLGISEYDLKDKVLMHITHIEQIDKITKLVVTANRLQFHIVKYGSRDYVYHVIGKSI